VTEQSLGGLHMLGGILVFSESFAGVAKFSVKRLEEVAGGEENPHFSRIGRARNGAPWVASVDVSSLMTYGICGICRATVV
jgi:hypothetical protein